MLSSSTSTIEKDLDPEDIGNQMTEIVNECCEKAVKAMLENAKQANPNIISQSHSTTIHDGKLYCTTIFIYFH